MQQPGTAAIPKRNFRRPKYECSKCSTRAPVDKVPEGWLIVWDDKRSRYQHYCLDCQDGRRGRKRT